MVSFRNFTFIPIAYNQEIIDQIENNQNKKEMVTENDEFNLEKTDNRNESLNFDLIEETDENYVFKFKILRHSYPYYLLEYNKNMLDDLNNELRSLFSASMTPATSEIYFIKAVFSKKNLSNDIVSREYNNWSYHLNNFLNQHVNRSFTQYTIPINDKNLFNYIRYKAINYYSKSDSISLIFKNDLNDFWIRIEGETKLMETEKKKIEKDIHFYNQNSFLML